jgi:hypothetical protein
MSREKAFNLWIDLKFEMQELAAIVQNPIEYLTDDDKARWESRVMQARARFDEACRETRGVIA